MSTHRAIVVLGFIASTSVLSMIDAAQAPIAVPPSVRSAVFTRLVASDSGPAPSFNAWNTGAHRLSSSARNCVESYTPPPVPTDCMFGNCATAASQVEICATVDAFTRGPMSANDAPVPAVNPQASAAAQATIERPVFIVQSLPAAPPLYSGGAA